jgi:hypothetical protein
MAKKTSLKIHLYKQLHPCRVQDTLDEKKSKHAGLAQQIGFGPAFVKFAEPGRRHDKV